MRYLKCPQMGGELLIYYEFMGKMRQFFRYSLTQEVPDFEETIICWPRLSTFTSKLLHNIFHIIHVSHQVDVLTQFSRPLIAIA